jgi:hypothetical protein
MHVYTHLYIIMKPYPDRHDKDNREKTVGKRICISIAASVHDISFKLFSFLFSKFLGKDRSKGLESQNHYRS